MAKTSTKKSPTTGKSAARKPVSSATKSRAKAAPTRVGSSTRVPAPAAAKLARAIPAAKSRSNDKPANHRTPERSGPRHELPPPRPIPVAVPTDGKPRKNEAGLGIRALEHYRDLLLAKRRELVGDMSQMEREALRSSGGTNLSTLPIHMADMGTDNYEQEFTLGLVEKDRNLLREINAALAKIQNGTYGICEGTGKPINKPRLEAQPWARYSIEHARQLERGMGIGR